MAMQKVSVDQILKYVDKLSNQEKAELTTKILKFIPFTKEVSKEDRAIRELIEQGVLREEDVPSGKHTFEDFEPIKVQGEPVSETIIKDRR